MQPFHQKSHLTDITRMSVLRSSDMKPENRTKSVIKLMSFWLTVALVLTCLAGTAMGKKDGKKKHTLSTDTATVTMGTFNFLVFKK